MTQLISALGVLVTVVTAVAYFGTRTALRRNINTDAQTLSNLPVNSEPYRLLSDHMHRRIRLLVELEAPGARYPLITPLAWLLLGLGLLDVALTIYMSTRTGQSGTHWYYYLEGAVISALGAAMLVQIERSVVMARSRARKAQTVPGGDDE